MLLTYQCIRGWGVVVPVVGQLLQHGVGAQPPTYEPASAGGDHFRNNPHELTFLHVRNTGGAAATVTIRGRSDVAVIVPGGSERMIGPFPPKDFNRVLLDNPGGTIEMSNGEWSANGYGDAVRVDYSSTAGVFVAALSVVA